MARAEAEVERREKEEEEEEEEEEKGQNKDFAALSISTTSITTPPPNTTRKAGLLHSLSSACSITPKSFVVMVCISAVLSTLLLSILPLALHLQVAQSTVTVTGATGGVFVNGSRPFRQEIFTFQKSGPPMDLFVLAFRAFQQMDQSDVQSYYQIAGIHGFPIKAWDGVNGANKVGYCTHNSVVFPAWHRPYLALFEQILWGHAQTIARTYPLSLRSQYVTAAATLRLPYWDWAINPTMPTTFTTPKIDVTSPDGKVTIPNPLYNYTFHPLPLGTDFPTNQGLSFYRSTVRNPDKLGQSQQAISNQALASESASILSLTYQILSSEKNYSMMSNSVLGTYNSVENIHNGIHTWVGGTGHMALIPWSSFDPIFWIHHAQVDRIFALWQALNPNSYVEPYANQMGTFTEQPGFVETVDTPLTPFHFSSSLFYTAATARSTRAFGYSYSELPDWSVNSTQLQSAVRTKVNALYNPTTNSALKRGTRRMRKMKAPKITGHHHVDSASNETVDNDMMRVGPTTVEQYVQMGINNLPMQWAVSFQVDKFILSSPFSIHVFLTAPPADPVQWATCPQHVGSGTIFTMANTTVQPSVIVSGQVPLTHALAHAINDGILASLDAGHVVPLLKNSLEWRIQKVDGNPVDTEDLVDGKGKGGLKIGVISREVTPRVRDDAFPVYASWNTWPSITAGKVGGTKAAKPT